MELRSTAEEVNLDAEDANIMRDFGRKMSSVVGKAMEGECVEQTCYMAKSEEEVPEIGE